MNNLKVAIVGTGKVAEGNYLPILVADAEVSLGYYNRTRTKAETCAARFGGQVFDSVSALMDWQPDTVLVLTGEKDRYEAACALLEHKPRRLFFEKPLVAHHGQENVDEQDFLDGQKILQQAEAVGCESTMVFNYRFYEHSILARRIVAERSFGQVRNITGLVHYACWSHCIDLVHFFAGPIAEISALQGQTLHTIGWMSARDITAAFRTEGDATGTLVGTNTMAWKFPLFELTFNFERGRIRLQDLDGEMTIMDSSRMEVETYRIVGDASRWDQYNNSFKKSVQAYLQSIRDHQPPPVPVKYGLLELQVEAGMKRSIAQSRPVKLADEFSLNLPEI
jgi:predicted dehydrogenase